MTTTIIETGPEGPPDPRPARLTIDLGAIVANWRALQGRGSARVGAVLKADAYGCGARAVAPALYAAGCRHIFVAHPEEALSIRPLVPEAMVAVLNGLWPGAEGGLRAHGLVPVLGSLAEIAAWSAEARRAGRALPALIHIDTGMNRLGLSASELATLAHDPGRLAGIEVRYWMTHLTAADQPEDPANQAQRRRFDAACARLPAAPRSLANSSGLFLGPGFASDLARPGAALYGVNPTPGAPNPMRGAVRLEARVLAVRVIGAGERVGYNGVWQASRPSRIATVSVGYADGYMRSLSNRGGAYFDGGAAPLVGRVSMDLSTFDVTDLPGAVPGAWLELIGPAMSVDEVGRRAGTSGYEVLTSLGSRYARRYLPA